MSNRTYTSALNDGKGTPTFQYIWDASLVSTGAGRPITGNWRIFTTTDIATNNISLTGSNFVINNVAVTGGQIAITNGSITVVNPLLATSGNATIVNTAPIPVSGVVTIPFTAPVYVTGSFATSSAATVLLTGNSLVGITGGTLNVAVTGGVLSSSSSSIALTGFSPTLPPLPVSGSFTATPGNTAITGFNSTIAPLAISGIVTASVSTVDTGNRSVFLVNQAVVNSGGWVGITGGVSVLNQATINSGGWVGITGFSSLIAPLAVSGTFVATIGNVSVTGGQVSLTGGNVNVTDNLGWALLSGISGALTSNLSGAAWITGQVSVTNQATVNSGGWVGITGFSSLIAPLAVSGTFAATIGNVTVTGGLINVANQAVINSGGWVGITGDQRNVVLSGGFTAITGIVTTSSTITNTTLNIAVTGGSIQTIVTGTISSSITNPIGVTGTHADRALPIINGFNTNFLAIGGRVVNASGVGSITGYNSTGDMAIINISRENGAIFTNQGCLDKTQDEATFWAASTGSGPVSATGVSGLAPAFFGVGLPNNPNRRAWFVVNLGTGALMLKMSSTIPTTGNLDLFLKGATTAWAGDGASWTDSPAVYTGPVAVSGFGGAPCVYRMWDL